MFVVGFRRDRVSIGCLGRNSGGGPCAQSCSFQRSYGLPRGWSGVQNNTRGNILCGQRLEYTGYCEGCTYKLRQQQRAEQKRQQQLAEQARQRAEQERRRAEQERYAAEIEKARERREREKFLAAQAAEIKAKDEADQAQDAIENLDNALSYLNSNSPPHLLRLKTDSSGHIEIAETVGVDADEKAQIVSRLSWISKSFKNGRIDEEKKYFLKDAVIARNYLEIDSFIYLHP